MLGKLFGKKKNQSNAPKDSIQKQSFSLQTEYKEYTNEEINALLLTEIINSDIDIWGFMVLAPANPIEGSIFMQVTQVNDEGFPFFIEIGFGSKLHRLITKDKNIVLQHMTTYWQEMRIPDISLWEDVSDIIQN